MRRVIVSTYMTLDGRVDGIGEWALPHDDAGIAAYHTELLSGSDGLLLGRRTYEVFAALWPPLAGELPYVDQLNAMPKHVVSTTLTELEWENSHLVEGDPADGVARLKDRPGRDLVVYGCHDLMHTLLEHHLVDELRVLVQPVLLGTGRTFLREGAPRVDLELVDTQVIPGGVAILSYRPS